MQVRDMTTIETIQRVLASRILSEELTVVPLRGASPAALSHASQSFGRLDPALAAILQCWNGIDLDVVRVHGLGVVDPGIRHVEAVNGAIVFASDPAGFRYALQDDGRVVAIDHDGGDVRVVADGVDDFFQDLVFGNRAAEFGGPEWAKDVEETLSV
jgi:hypothetical protein